MPHRELQVGPDPADVRRARDWTSAMLSGDWIRAPQSSADTVVLLVSELVTNAVVHGRGPAVLRLVLIVPVPPPAPQVRPDLRAGEVRATEAHAPAGALPPRVAVDPDVRAGAADCAATPRKPPNGVHATGAELRLEVADSSNRGPLRRAAGCEETGGRGLELVDLLADRWGWRPEDGGKRVWCELRLPRCEYRHEPRKVPARS